MQRRLRRQWGGLGGWVWRCLSAHRARDGLPCAQAPLLTRSSGTLAPPSASLWNHREQPALWGQASRARLQSQIEPQPGDDRGVDGAGPDGGPGNRGSGGTRGDLEIVEELDSPPGSPRSPKSVHEERSDLVADPARKVARTERVGGTARKQPRSPDPAREIRQRVVVGIPIPAR